MIINGIEISGAGGSSGTSGISGSSGSSGSSGISGSSGSSGTRGSSGTSGLSGSSGSSGTSGSSGSSGVSGTNSNRFITSTRTLSAGLEEVLNDMFIISSTYSISSYNATYSIAGSIIYNNALLNILETIWIDGVLSVEGDFKLGLPQNNSFENLISIT